MAVVSMRNLSKFFGTAEVLHNVSIEVGSGEFFSVLGPSGCGKTTLLRLIAGLERPSSGRLLIGHEDVTDVPPRDRGVGLVFQNYALFPHMTVKENVAFGLQVIGIPATDIATRIERVLDSVHLALKSSSHVSELSGGEQQRVAVARAVVVEPRVLLFDEPLSNLDISLRASTRKEIKELQRRTGITTIYVTHDQEEALGLSDRIAVMNNGRVEQIGRPEELYNSPASPFVAEFLGGANILRGTYIHADGIFHSGPVDLSLGRGRFGADMPDVVLAIKPEQIRIGSKDSPANLEAQVLGIEYGGFTTRVSIAISGITLRALFVTSEIPAGLMPGDRLAVWCDTEGCPVFPRS